MCVRERERKGVREKAKDWEGEWIRLCRFFRLFYSPASDILGFLFPYHNSKEGKCTITISTPVIMNLADIVRSHCHHRRRHNLAWLEIRIEMRRREYSQTSILVIGLGNYVFLSFSILLFSVMRCSALICNSPVHRATREKYNITVLSFFPSRWRIRYHRPRLLYTCMTD